jgi:tetratricopeptide (TPR) repeat protein
MRTRFVILLVPIFGTSALAAQQLPLKRDVPAVAWAGCPQMAEKQSDVSPDRRQEAARLAEAATQASILGNKTAALDLLVRAAETDPTSTTIAYNLARTFDELERRTDAVAAYCRYLDLAPDVPDAQDVRQRTRALATPPGFAAPAAAVRAFEAGISHYDAGRLAEAEATFGLASNAAPGWSAPVYNRAVIRAARAQTEEAAADFRRFIEMDPGAPEFNAVLDLLTTFRQPAQTYNPGGALVRGLLVPGLGQFTTGRPGTGILVLGTASGALAAGLLVKRLSVDCLSPPVDGRCPPGLIARTVEKRPYLLPAVGVAAASAVLGAIDAYRGASRRNRQPTTSTRVGLDGHPRGPSLALPGISLSLRSAQLDLVRIRF